MPNFATDRFMLVARSLVYPEELYKLPAVIETNITSGSKLAFHCTFHRGGAFLFKVKMTNTGFRSLDAGWELRAIVELTRAQYLSVIDDFVKENYVHSPKRQE